MSDDGKSTLLEIAGDLDMSTDGSQCRIEVSSADGTPLSPQHILDAVSDMLMHYFSLDASYWVKPEDEDMDS